MAACTRPSVLVDARAIAAADLAGQGSTTTLLSYPGLHAVAAHRLAHRLWSDRWGKPGAQAIATASAKATGITLPRVR
jgi:serine O-acetyltransferase